MPAENTSPEAVLESVTARLATLERTMEDWKALIAAGRTKAEETQDSALSQTLDELEGLVSAQSVLEGTKLLLDPELFSVFLGTFSSSTDQA